MKKLLISSVLPVFFTACASNGVPPQPDRVANGAYSIVVNVKNGLDLYQRAPFSNGGVRVPIEDWDFSSEINRSIVNVLAKENPDLEYVNIADHQKIVNDIRDAVRNRAWGGEGRQGAEERMIIPSARGTKADFVLYVTDWHGRNPTTSLLSGPSVFYGMRPFLLGMEVSAYCNLSIRMIDLRTASEVKYVNTLERDGVPIDFGSSVADGLVRVRTNSMGGMKEKFMDLCGNHAAQLAIKLINPKEIYKREP